MMSPSAQPAISESTTVMKRRTVLHLPVGAKRSPALSSHRAGYFNYMFEECPIGVTISRSGDGRFVEANSAFLSTFGLKADDVIGHTATELGLWPDPEVYTAMLEKLQRDGMVNDYAAQLRGQDGRTREVALYAKQMALNGEGLVLQILFDVTLDTHFRGNLSRLAFYDELTHLPNRRLLMERLTQALITSERRIRHGAVLFIDLDDFKSLNDALGHQSGDRLLYEFGQRLMSSVREQDTVARLGGDEFVILLEDLNDSEALAKAEAQRIAEKVMRRANQPYIIEGHHCTCSPSIGTTLFFGKGDSAETLLDRADRAMYEAKSSGKNCIVYLPPDDAAH